MKARTEKCFIVAISWTSLRDQLQPPEEPAVKKFLRASGWMMISSASISPMDQIFPETSVNYLSNPPHE